MYRFPIQSKVSRAQSGRLFEKYMKNLFIMWCMFEKYGICERCILFWSNLLYLEKNDYTTLMIVTAKLSCKVT